MDLVQPKIQSENSRSWSSVLVRYTIKEFLFSFTVAFLFFIVIFFVNQILVIARDRLSENVSIIDTLRLIVFAMPAIVALSFPFGTLLAVLMTTGKLASDNEILALQASGISLPRIFIPLMAVGLLFSGISFVTNDYFLPLGTLRYTQLYQELLFSNSELVLQPNSIQRYDESTIITGDVRSGIVYQVVILDQGEEQTNRIISAETAQIIRNAKQDGVISLSLGGVTIHEADIENPRDYTLTTSDTMVYSILLNQLTNSIRNPSAREMSSLDVYDLILAREGVLRDRWLKADREIALALSRLISAYHSGGDGPQLQGLITQIDDLRNQPRVDRTLQLYKIEFWKKFSIPFACFTFIILGFPVGLIARHNGRAVGFGIGVLFAVVYWALLLGGEALGVQNLRIPPMVAMLFPNVMMVLAGVILYTVKTRR